VILRRRATDPPEGVQTDLEMLSSLAAALGKGQYFSCATARDVFEELRRATRGAPADYSGISYERIEAENGVFWPCPSPDHPGTPRLFADRFATSNGRARFHGVSHQPPADDRDVEYPLYLTTGRVLAQYQSGTQTRHVEELQQVASAPLAEMHPATARLHGVVDGERVRLTTRRGNAVYTVKLSAAIREDTVFVPFHWGGDQSINRLTNPALDPISRMPEFKVCAVSATAVSAAKDSE
jgi:assimilatory nitrate reductase catalytic subunit